MTGPTFATDCGCGRRVARQFSATSSFMSVEAVWIRCRECGTPNWCPKVDGASEPQPVAEVDG